MASRAVRIRRLPPAHGGRCGTIVWARLHRPRGRVYVPPLIGGGAGQQLRTFRALLRGGYELVSHGLPGHGDNPGRFSVAAAAEAVGEGLAAALSMGGTAGLPLFAIGCCYAAGPLIHALDEHGEPLDGVVLVNAVWRIDPALAYSAFLTHRRASRADGVAPRGPLAAVHSFVGDLLPEADIGGRAFGSLELRRTRVLKTLVEAGSGNLFRNRRLPRTPTLCLYGRQDRVLHSVVDRAAGGYERHVRAVFPRARFHPLEAGHFLSQPAARRETLAAVVDHFETCAGYPENNRR